MNYNNHNLISRYWLDENLYEDLKLKYSINPNICLGELVEKSLILKTISNFVNIITDGNENIDVKFEGQEAKADSKEIFISADVEDFDLVCGLSLHESSHIKYSQYVFELLKTAESDLNNLINNKNTVNNPIAIKIADWHKTWKIKITPNSVTRMYQLIHSLINIVEDFRIDTLTQSKFPGYKGYYDKILKKYLFTDKITNALKNDIKLNEESYFSYKINILAFLYNHPDNNLLKLKGGKEIVDILEPYQSMIASKSGHDVLDISFKIFETITKYIVKDKQSKQDNNNLVDEKSRTQKDNKHNELKNKNSGKNDNLNNLDDENKPEDNNKLNNENGEDNNQYILEELKNDEQESKAFEELMKALNGEYAKTKLSSDEQYIMNIISNNIFKIKTTTVKNPDTGKNHKIDVVVINKLDESVFKYVTGIVNPSMSKYVLEEIKVAINLGRSLGAKLQIMNDTHITKSTRKRYGNIDNRLLSEIGHGNVKIFARSTKTEYKKQFVHISIDSSGSMEGNRFVKSLKLAATIASAATYVNGMRVQVSIRSTSPLIFDNSDIIYKIMPHVIIIYDSKFDTLKHITDWWPRLNCPGVTPEAICFEAIKDIIFESSKDKNSYFVNISDGVPEYELQDFVYSNFARKHTQEVMKSFRKAGIKVISYFIGDYSLSKPFFMDMYGKDANFIDINNINEIARTLNRKFLNT